MATNHGTSLSTAELCNQLGISRTTAWRLRRKGKLNCYRLGYRTLRYSEQQIKDFLATSTESNQSINEDAR